MICQFCEWGHTQACHKFSEQKTHWHEPPPASHVSQQRPYYVTDMITTHTKLPDNRSDTRVMYLLIPSMNSRVNSVYLSVILDAAQPRQVTAYCTFILCRKKQIPSLISRWHMIMTNLHVQKLINCTEYSVRDYLTQCNQSSSCQIGA